MRLAEPLLIRRSFRSSDFERKHQLPPGTAGWTDFGPGAVGSNGGLGDVGVTVAPAARAVSLVVR
jgi:hypothetical protein